MDTRRQPAPSASIDEPGHAKPTRGGARRPDIRPEKSRTAILASARELFLDRGYDINLEEVALRAGVVKATLYNHFANKRALLEAVMEREHEVYRQSAPAFEQGEGDLRSLLTHYASLHRMLVLNADGIKFFRLIVGDVSQFPDTAARFYRDGIEQVLTHLASQLQAGVDEGKVRPIDTLRAAERFYSALGGMAQRRAVAGLGMDSPEFQEAYLAETVDAFVEVLTPKA